MSSAEDYIGFIRYTGEPLEQGYLSTRKSAEALLGFDEAIRHFVGKQDAELAKVDYEIPVQIRTGSWIAMIPYCIGIVATAYLTSAATQMAKNDFKDAGAVDVFKKSIKGIQWTIRIGKHLGTLVKQPLENLKFRKANKEIGIANQSGEYLYVPQIYLKFYEEVPVHLLKKLASLVSDDIELEVGVREDKEDQVENLSVAHKDIFCPDSKVLLFPELEHGREVKLVGLVTRGNENANSIGFQYKGHILTCYPEEGSIVRFKPSLFVRSEISGVITREDDYGEISELRPKIIFNSLVPIEQESNKGSQPGLFDDDTQ